MAVDVAPGTKESSECCREFLENPKRRGLPDPVLVVTDGGPGLIRSVEERFLEDFEACIAHLRCPPAHRRVIRTLYS